MATAFLFLLAIHSLAFGLTLGKAGDSSILPGIAVRQGEPKTVVAHKNSQFLLNCSVTHDPSLGELSFQWRKDGQVLELDSRVRSYVNGSLFFRKILHKPRKNRSDEGQYECLASITGVGTLIARRVTVQIAGIDRDFTEKPLDQRVAVGGAARYQCHINAVPSPYYIWERNRTALPHDDNRLLTLPSGILQITKVTESDTGHYRCRATQGLRQAQSGSDIENYPDYGREDGFYEKFSDEAALDVVKESTRPPSIVAVPKNVTATIRQSIVLECLVDGEYDRVVWTHQGKEVVVDSRKTMLGTNLRIADLMDEDSGVYVCSVTSANSPPRTFSASATVNVYRAPVITSSSQSSRNMEWKLIYLNCTADGNPTPARTWYKDGKKIVFSSKLRMVNNQLVIIQGETDASGYYQCFMENEVGFATTHVRLNFYQPAGTPDRVTNIQAVNITRDLVQLKWEPAKTPDNFPVIAYSIRYTVIGTQIAADKVTKSNSIVLMGLPAYSNISLEVTGFNTKGAGLTSDIFYVQTKEDVPSGPVKITMEPSTRSIQLTWRELPPNKQNGIITMYRIMYRNKGSDDLTVSDVDGKEKSFLIEDLEPNAEYEVRMMAGTSAGFTYSLHDPISAEYIDRDWPWVVTRTLTKEVPIRPQMQVVPINETAVQVTWNQSGSSSPIRGFTLHIRNLQNGKNTTVIPLPAVTRHYVLSNLEENLLYEITLVVEFADGSSFSISQECSTSSDTHLPAPRNLRVALLTSTSIEINWDQPVSLTTITHYTVRYSQLGGDQKFRTSDTTQILLENLEPGTEYEVAVSAHNEKISSPYSVSVIHSTKEVVAAPQEVSTKWTDSGVLSLKWLPPVTVDPVLSYTVLYTIDPNLPDDKWTSVTISGDEMMTTFPDLLETVYYFKVQALTDEGPGIFSDVVRIDLEGGEPAAEANTKLENQKLGIIIGVSIGVFCIIICIVVILLRVKYYSAPYNQTAETQPVHYHGNGHIPGHGNGHAVATGDRRLSAEHYEMEDCTPMLLLPENENSDSKGGGNGNVILTPNGAKLNGFVPLKKNGIKNGQISNGHVPYNHYKKELLEDEESHGLISAMLNSTTGSGGECMTDRVAEDSFSRTRFEDLASSLDDIDRSTEDMSAHHHNTGTSDGSETATGSDRNSDIDPMCMMYSGGSLSRSDTTGTGETVVLRAGFAGGGDGGGSSYRGDRPPSSVSGDGSGERSGSGNSDRGTMSSISSGDPEGVESNRDYRHGDPVSMVMRDDVCAESSAVLPQNQACTTSCHSQALKSVVSNTPAGGSATMTTSPTASLSSSGQRREPHEAGAGALASPQGNANLNSSVPQTSSPVLCLSTSPQFPHQEEIQFAQLPQDVSGSLPRRQQDYV